MLIVMMPAAVAAMNTLWYLMWGKCIDLPCIQSQQPARQLLPMSSLFLLVSMVLCDPNLNFKERSSFTSVDDFLSRYDQRSQKNKISNGPFYSLNGLIQLFNNCQFKLMDIGCWKWHTLPLVPISVTRFGEILPLSIWHTFELSLTIFLLHLANFHSYKWPNIEK